jgi:hypothetical protein
LFDARILDMGPDCREIDFESIFPADLREWVSEDELVRIVAETAARFTCEPRTLLTLLTFFYAVGEYSSDEIEESLAHSAVTSAAQLANQTGISATLRQFRRGYREMIEESLAVVLREAAKTGSATDVQREARSRMIRAIETDCWALDD